MSKSIKILWAMFTLLPIVYFIFFISFVSSLDQTQSAVELNAQLKHMFYLHIVSMSLMVVLILSYVVYLFKSGIVPKDKRVLWAVVLIAGNMFAMPFFWFFYVWRAPAKINAE
ncbi:MAG: hypothetical protein U1B30_11995 [Pseudomonadota bacterium]|nr:hypothetical protein [Pseudomonadota bacterium]